MFKKGSVIFRDVSLDYVSRTMLTSLQYELVDPNSHNITQTIDAQAEPVQQSKSQKEKDKKSRAKARVVVEHLDIIKDDFWDRRPWLLSNKPGKIPKET
jgi:tRNA(His) guanylyltransferase